MESLGIFGAIGRSNILEYNPLKRGINGTLYIDYENKIGYIWDKDSDNYVEVFNQNTTRGLTFKGTYDTITNIPNISELTKQNGDYWICTDSENFGDWLIWNGEEFYRINSDENNGEVEIITEGTTLLMFDCTYLIDSSNSNIRLTIPYSTNDNKGQYINIIKTSDDSNTVYIKNGRTSVTYDLHNKNDMIGFISSGTESLDWVMDNSYRINEPVKYLELEGNSDSKSKADDNWKIVPSGSDLLFQRYSKEIPYTMAKIGQEISTDNYILDDVGGRLLFKNSQGETRTLISPSKDASGVAVGNPIGRISLLNNGGLYNATFEQNETSNIINVSASEYLVGKSFSYHFMNTDVMAINSGTIYLSKVQEGTRLRFTIEDTNGNKLEENVTKFDFESSMIKGGLAVTVGSNIANLLESLPLPSDYEFILSLYFTDNVTICGSTMNLNDGLGTRFIPTLSFTCFNSILSEVSHSGNIKRIIDGLTSSDRVDSKSIYDGVFISSTDLILTKEHINHPIIFNHPNGTVNCKIETSGIFTQGDKITIYSKYATVKFTDIDTNETYEIKRDEVSTLQKTHDGNWFTASKFAGEGYGNRLYYFVNTTNTLTSQQIKSNISKYDYTVDWNIGNNTFNTKVESVGEYYVYCILPTDFAINDYNYIDNCVLNGISYDIFVSKIKMTFAELSGNITIGVYTDVLAYTEIPTENELLIGDGTRLGIKGCGITYDNIVVDNDITNVVRTPDVNNGCCLARKLNGLQEVIDSTDTIILFNTEDTAFCYNQENVGMSYLDGVFTNESSTKVLMLTISYQVEWEDNTVTDKSVWLRVGTNDIKLGITNGSITIPILASGIFSLYCKNTNGNTNIMSSIQIVNILPTL